MTSTKPYSAACDRNREPILEVLRTHFGDRRSVLEIGSGTGQHAVHFAAAMPWLRWQCSDHRDYLLGIRMWLDEAALPNTPPPFELQAVAEPTPHFAPLAHIPAEGVHVDTREDERRGLGRNFNHDARPRYDGIFSANTLHIMGWPEVRALFAALPSLLADDAVVAIYGPFNIGGEYTSESNREFDAALNLRDPRSGLRDLEAVQALAEGIGLRAVAEVAMPANNRLLIWHRSIARRQI